MNKLIFSCFFITSLLSGCSMSNLHPKSQYTQHLKNVTINVTKVDRGAIYITLLNNTPKPLEINWAKSTINNKNITKDIVNELELPIKNTVINPGDTINATLYIKENIFYRDPVLYQPGGYQIKDISYPATLNLLIDNVNNTKTIYFNN